MLKYHWNYYTYNLILLFTATFSRIIVLFYSNKQYKYERNLVVLNYWFYPSFEPRGSPIISGLFGANKLGPANGDQVKTNEENMKALKVGIPLVIGMLLVGELLVYFF